MSAAPDDVVPLSGWRTWRIDLSGPEARLAPVVRRAAWPVGEALAAECPGITFAHHASWPGCRCGIHVARDAAWDLTACGVPVGVLVCGRRGVLEALRAAAPSARRPRPLPVAAPAGR